MTTLKQIKPILNKFKKQNRPILTNALVKGNELRVTDLETDICFKSDFGLEEGLHSIETIGLVDALQDNIEDYPLFQESSKNESFTFNLETIENLLPFCSKDETRLNLNGIALNDGNFVACDGHTLNNYPILEKLKEDYIIPRTSLEILVKLLKKYKIKDDFNCSICGTYFTVNNDNFIFTARLIQRDYAKWRTVIPKKFEGKAFINNWVNFKELKPLLNKRTKSSRLEFKNGEVTLIITGYENNKYIVGKCDKSLDKTIGFNMSYLERASLGNKVFEIKFNNELNPVKVNEAIVMPLRL